jgi:glycosyltransferase involved in cell wall biosynthesis
VSEALISVVTPFRNTAPYLAECIESVLRQSHVRFEYILSDNGSDDGSTDIAELYARQDSRIRLVRQPRALSQVQHYNAALSEISKQSEYCKIVQADDSIFPDCLRLMAHIFEQSQSIGLVSSYDIKGDHVRASGFPYPAAVCPGREVARLYLRTGLFPFGSPNTVMYRSSLVREESSFFDESLLHEDTEKCMQILEEWDFGFVHQVLSFMRTENVNESVSAKYQSFYPDELDRYIIVQRYATRFLGTLEAAEIKRNCKNYYYRRLAKAWLRGVSAAFWDYHSAGMHTLGERLDRRMLVSQVARESVSILVNPGTAISKTVRAVRQAIRNRHNKGVKQSVERLATE